MLAPFVHFLPLATIVRKRIMPYVGNVTVNVGQMV